MPRTTPRALACFVALSLIACSGGSSDPAAPPSPSALVVTTTSLANGVVGAAYAATLTAGGGTQPYSWSRAGGYLPPGIALASNGTLSGTPSVSGTYVCTVRVSDGSSPAQAATASLGITVLADAGSAQITTASLAGGTVGSAYSATLVAAGGTGPYVWSVAAGALPPGLTLGADGALSGTPTETGSATFVVQVADGSTPPELAQKQFTMTIGTAPLTVTTVSLPKGVLGAPYAEAVAANGGAEPYAWSVVAGTLPPGLALDVVTGALAGSPTATGGYTFTVQAADASTPQKVASQAFSVTIAAASNALVITTTAFGDGVVGAPYAAHAAAIGGTAPYTWSVSGGALPPGLALDAATGELAGVPTEAGSHSFTLRVLDASAPQKNFSAPFTLRVFAPLEVTTESLADGAVGAPYSAALEAAGGLPPYALSLASGSLPPGLTLGTAGAIEGTPTASGIYGFAVQVTDSANPKQTISVNRSIAIP
ncbi:putative Ig domain-containing protein [Anaeromyxobacter terrae]|uniref:putative Ig domain-containing protein n=1 Tax=Anaeromyxobacter terrae TaxID=2925406 RepID=UPI001F57F7A2|nr:putative Ig domain-containing protein [Anaeromyxobacter sp. SG22]